MITISSNFIGSFKLGDNIVYNLEILSEFYSNQNSGNVRQQKLMRKPIIVLIASIAEAILFDLYLRIENFTREGVPNIPEAVLEEIRTKTLDQFAKYIDNSKSKNLLVGCPDIYDNLHTLRMLRNRIHIQNSKNHFEPDDEAAFTSDRQNTAEITLECLMKIMERDYTRSGVGSFVDDFVLPWCDHVTI